MDYGYNTGYSTTSYGAQGGAGGGGFMTGGTQTSPSVNRSYKDGTLRPVTIKQLNEAESIGEADFKVDNAQIDQCTFVGQVRNISQQATNVTYKIDDGTGTIEVKQWIDPDNENDVAKGKIADNSYVRVWGRLKSFGNKRHVGAHVIRPISDFNEINYHLLEATAVHLFFVRGPPSGAKGGASGMNDGQDTHMGNGGDFSIGGGLPAGLSVTAKKVYHCLATTPQSNEGLHEQDVASRLNMNVADINAGADQLLEQGLIYSTVDEHTWAILNTDGIGI